MTVTSHAVGSYPTISPLPDAKICTIGGVLSVALSVDAVKHRPGIIWQRVLWSPDFPRVLVYSRLSSQQCLLSKHNSLYTVMHPFRYTKRGNATNDEAQ